MDPFTLESGCPSPRSDRAEVCRSGKMAPCMRATLRIIRSMDWVGCCIRMVKSTKVTGKMTMRMGLDVTLTRMGHSTRVGG